MEKQPQIIELSCVKINDSFEVVDSIDTFINPCRPLDAEITKITGITDDDLKGQPKFEEVYKELSQFFLGTSILVCHNLPFDRSLLTYELERIDRLRHFPWPIQHICTAAASKRVVGYRMKLVDLYEQATGRKHVKAHRARGDVDATIECFKYLTEKGHI